jgi:hypothetical protein
MPKLLLLFVTFAVSFVLAAALDNQAVVKMVRAGLGDDVIIGVINSQSGTYALTPDDLVALKSANVTDKVIAVMIARSNAAVQTMTVAAPILEVGIYVKRGGEFVDLKPEVVNWKTGGVLKSMGTMGVVKGDVNGHIHHPHSPNDVKTPVELMVYAQDGVAITEYQLIKLHDHGDSREFRTVTGGVFHVSGGTTRDDIEFQSKKTAPRTYVITLNDLRSGEYGILPPGIEMSSKASASLGKMYTFRIIE